jgi:hypothetical protein
MLQFASAASQLNWNSCTEFRVCHRYLSGLSGAGNREHFSDEDEEEEVESDDSRAGLPRFMRVQDTLFENRLECVADRYMYRMWTKEHLWNVSLSDMPEKAKSDVNKPSSTSKPKARGGGADATAASSVTAMEAVATVGGAFLYMCVRVCACVRERACVCTARARVNYVRVHLYA